MIAYCQLEVKWIMKVREELRGRPGRAADYGLAASGDVAESDELI